MTFTAVRSVCRDCRMVGKNKMKDWKASVRTWEPKNQPETKGDDLFWKAVEAIANESV